MSYIIVFVSILLIYALIGFLLIYNKRLKIKRILKIGYILLGIGLLSFIGTYTYVFHKPQRNIVKEKPTYVISAEQLYKEFSAKEDSSYIKYGDKVVEVKGPVSEITINNNSASITLLDEISGINCSFDSVSVVEHKGELEKIKQGDNITLKGKCDGYDMIMGVVLTRCVLLKKN